MERDFEVKQLKFQILSAKSKDKPFSKLLSPTMLNKNNLYKIIFVKLEA